MYLEEPMVRGEKVRRENETKLIWILPMLISSGNAI